MPPPNSSRTLRLALNAGLGACTAAWLVLLTLAVAAAADGDRLHPLVYLLGLLLATVSGMLGVMRAAVWLLNRIQLQSIGSMLGKDAGKSHLQVVDARPS